MCESNPNGALMCCICCGRDTRSVHGLCFRCGGGGPRYLNCEDRRGRKERSLKVVNGSEIPERTEDEAED
jgi:hypothetical protein